MRALIMAGGAGCRLNCGEKPLILIRNQPMISYVIHAFSLAGCEPVVAVSPKTPMTLNWCRAHDIMAVRTTGGGFVNDMIQTVQALEEDRPLVISVSDIPCITSGTIRAVLDTYIEAGKDALSTWVPATLMKSCREGMPYRERINGIEACPAGINILRGDRIAEVQEEYTLLLNEPCLALNVNTAADRTRAEKFLCEQTENYPEP